MKIPSGQVCLGQFRSIGQVKFSQVISIGRVRQMSVRLYQIKFASKTLLPSVQICNNLNLLPSHQFTGLNAATNLVPSQGYYQHYIRGLKQSLVAAKTLRKTEIQGAIQSGLQGTEIPCTRCVSHTVYLAIANTKSFIYTKGI